jgi:hypothetical protein
MEGGVGQDLLLAAREVMRRRTLVRRWCVTGDDGRASSERALLVYGAEGEFACRRERPDDDASGRSPRGRITARATARQTGERDRVDGSRERSDADCFHQKASLFAMFIER